MEDWFAVGYESSYFVHEPLGQYGRGCSERERYIEAMRKRTKAAAVAIIDFFESTRSTPALNVVRYQLIKSATSTAANYRAACVARSGREFFAKISIVVEEADETVFWLEVLYDSQVKVDKQKVVSLGKEWREITKMVSAARKSYRDARP